MDGNGGPPPPPRCPRCGAELEASSNGKLNECPGCLFSAGLGEQGPLVGDYRLLGPLGEGGTAVVHLAENLGTGDLVALKVAKAHIPHAEAVFRNELRNARRLRGCTGIVPVQASGRSDDGRAFLALELMEGGSLADAIGLGRYTDRREALALVGTLARLLGQAHDRAVLHCDIKPENVLFDAQGEPQLADFGVAELLEDASPSAERTVGGTRGWMSPEQARRRSSAEASSCEALSVASDVFGLGVLLYWLLTRTVPFGNGPDFEERVQSEAAPSLAPRRLFPKRLEWECAAICRRALQTEPKNRYGSAAALADDVERALADRPLAEELSRPLRRVTTWVSRHKLLAFAAFELCLLLLYLPLVPLLVLGQSRAVLEDQNANAALHQAGAVMNELRDFADHLRAMAEDPRTLSLLVDEQSSGDSDPARGRVVLTDYLKANLDNFVLFAPDGQLRHRWPLRTALPRSPSFKFRDYFQGALGLAAAGSRQIYVPRLIRSQTTGKLELEISTPLYDSKGEFVGVLGASLPVRSTFGTVQMNCAGAGRCLTGLLGPRDRDDEAAPLPEHLIFVAAPELQNGREVILEPALSSRICGRFGCTPAPRDQFLARMAVTPLVEDFIDPVSGAPSLGAFAPVGRTGLVVLVSTPQSGIRALTDRFLDKARSYLGIPAMLGVTLFGLLLAGRHLRIRSPLGRARPASRHD